MFAHRKNGKNAGQPTAKGNGRKNKVQDSAFQHVGNKKHIKKRDRHADSE
jgi:hypothetical protein